MISAVITVIVSHFGLGALMFFPATFGPLLMRAPKPAAPREPSVTSA
ncbi:hypothetical protein ACYZT4_06735 [Pseudomonas sp. GB2N2]